MRFLSYAYRFVSNFVFLGLVYFSLNFMEKYQQRAIVAILVLLYAGMRAASALRTFYFFQRIERLDIKSPRVIALVPPGGAQSPIKTKTVADVALLRRDGEINSFIDLFFLAAVVLLCVAKIVND